MVLVCHKHRFIYMKTRKTAGTSIEMLLEPLCAPPDHQVVERTQTKLSSYGVIGRRLIPDEERGTGKQARWREHLQANKVRWLLGPWKWYNYFRFTSVRNPFDRAVSSFHWRYDAEGVTIPTDMAGCKSTFRDFVLEGRMKDDFGVTHIGRKYAIQDAIRFEDLQADTARICVKLDLPVDSSALPRTKTHTSRPKDRYVADYFDPETTRALREQMAWVFEQYDYPPNPIDCDVAKRMSKQL